MRPYLSWPSALWELNRWRPAPPLRVVANALTTPVSTVVTNGASTAMLGVLLSRILGISRMMLAMGRRNDLPPFFQKIHGRYKVPHLGILFTGLLILILTLTGSFRFIIERHPYTIALLQYHQHLRVAGNRVPNNVTGG